MKRAIIFDVDGTLIATRQLYVAAYARCLERSLGRLLSDDEVMALRPQAETAFVPHIAGPAASAQCLEDFYRHYEALHRSHFRGIYDGVHDMLAMLRSKNKRLAIVTGKSRRAWRITERFADLGPFDHHVFGDELVAQKPAPEGLNRALTALKVAAADTLYVGDSASDLEAARTAGVGAAAALWSKRPSERTPFRKLARELGAEVFDKPAALAAWLT